MGRKHKPHLPPPTASDHLHITNYSIYFILGNDDLTSGCGNLVVHSEITYKLIR